MLKIKRVRLFLMHIWQPTAGVIAGLAVAGILLIYKLGTLVSGFSSAEVSSLNSGISISSIIGNPINAPYKSLVLISNFIYELHPITARLGSVLVGLAAVCLFFYIISRWHTVRVAIFTTALFATSSWFLHYGRSATADVYLLLSLLALAYGIWINRTQRSAMAVFWGVVIASGLLYLPGMIWLVVIGGIWQRKKIMEHVRHAQFSTLTLTLVGVGILTPLIAGLGQNPQLLRECVGLPAGSLPSAYDVIRHILNVPYQIVIRSNQEASLWLGNTPLIDIFTTVMATLGAYSYFRHRKLDRSKLVFGALFISTLLVGLRGMVGFAVILPFIYILAGAGIAFFIRQWFSVFPRNPLAKFISISLLTVAVSLSCFYNLKHYFVAWPNNPETKSAHGRQLH